MGTDAPAPQKAQHADAAFRQALLKNLDRIATALEVISKNGLAGAAPVVATTSPDYQRGLADYIDFDWSSIDARVMVSDEHGPTQVEWNNIIFTRRAPDNKYGRDIWYSHYVSTDDQGNKKYDWLISFKQAAEVDPLPKKVQNEMRLEAEAKPPVIEGRKPVPGIAAPAVPSQTKQAAPAPEQKTEPATTEKPIRLTVEEMTVIGQAAYPSDCIPLLECKEPRYKLVIVWKVGMTFKLDKEALTALCDKYRKQTPPDWAAALKEMDKRI